MDVDQMYVTGFDKSSYETYVEEERAIDAEYIPTYSFDEENLVFEDVHDTKWIFIRLILPKTPSLPILHHFLREFYEDFPFIRYVDDSHGDALVHPAQFQSYWNL